MTSWTRLDNASNIFLAARNVTDTKVFRLSATFKEPVQADLLQKALDHVYPAYPIFHTVIRRGIFWYYMEESDLQPKVKKENKPPCSAIYNPDHPGLLFRVIYSKRSVHLEIFHVLTDGTGAKWFLEDLVENYLALKAGQELQSVQVQSNAYEDSFRTYFGKGKISQSMKKLTLAEKTKAVHQIKGKATPDHRVNLVTADLSVNDLLAKAKASGVSLTIYLIARYLLSVYKAENLAHKRGDQSLSISVPVNLRPLFPSYSGRNFFTTTVLTYTFTQGQDSDFQKLADCLNEQLQAKLNKSSLEEQLEQFIAFEKFPLARLTPRVIKDWLLKQANRFNNRQVSLAMSNLGKSNLEGVDPNQVASFSFATSVIRPQFCMVTHQETLSLTFASPFRERMISDIFLADLAKEGIRATISANNLTNDVETKKGDLYPYVTLIYDRKAVNQAIFYISIVAVLFYLLLAWLTPLSYFGLEYVFFGLLLTWLSVVILIRRKHQMTKGILGMLTVVGLAQVALDWSDGGLSWSLDFGLPISFVAAMIGLLIVARYTKLTSKDYLYYILITGILGLSPILFVWFNLVDYHLPSLLCTLFSLTVLISFVGRYHRGIKEELQKRLHL